tara:strand:- start:48 stop:290 length:243 start_codon:yes stop_codon:yes gene_type:complete
MTLENLNQQQVVAYALAMAITAPSDKEADQAVGIAEEMTKGLTPKDVTLAKFKARELVEKGFIMMTDSEVCELLSQVAKW